MKSWDARLADVASSRIVAVVLFFLGLWVTWTWPGRPVMTIPLRDKERVVEFSATGQLAATREAGQAKLRFWDLRTGNVKREVTVEPLLEAIAISPDGKRAIMRNRCLEIETGRQFEFEHNPHSVLGPQGRFSPDGQTLIVKWVRGTLLRLLNSDTGDLRHEFADAVDCSYSADGKTLAVILNNRERAKPDTASVPSLVRLFDAKTFEPRMTLADEGGYVFAVAFSSDGRRLAIAQNFDAKTRSAMLDANYECKVGIWNLETKTNVQTLSAGHGKQGDMRFLADDKVLYLRGALHQILWDFSLPSPHIVSDERKLPLFNLLSDNGRRLAFTTGPEVGCQELGSGRETELWRRSGSAPALFTPHSERLLIQVSSHPFAPRLWAHNFGRALMGQSASLNHLSNYEVVDSTTGRTLGEIPASGLQPLGFVERGGETLLVTCDIATTPASAIQIWRVPTRRPWLLIFGLPLFVALLPMSITRWRKKM